MKEAARDWLDLAALDISTRYPVGMGLLPAGRPTREEGERLVIFAEEVMVSVRDLLEDHRPR